MVVCVFTFFNIFAGKQVHRSPHTVILKGEPPHYLAFFGNFENKHCELNIILIL